MLNEKDSPTPTQSIWVIGFDKDTGEYVDFCCCPAQDATFYKRLYESKGYRVETMTRDELELFLERRQ